jgi:hypothetical protein
MMATQETTGSKNLFTQAKVLEDSCKYQEAGDLYLQAALGFIQERKIDEGIMYLMCAAKAYEKDESWRKIGALWESIGEKIISNLENKSLDASTADSLCRHKVIGLPEWNSQKDLYHRAAWVFQWAAQHFEREGGAALVSSLFNKAALAAEQTTFCDRHRWAGMLFEKASVYSIRAIASQEEETDFKKLFHKMEENYTQVGIADERKISEKWAYLSRGYRNIRLAFQAIGDSIMAEEIRQKELEARRKYESTSGKYFRALITWLSSHVWVVPVAWVLTVFVIFPLIYWSAKVLVGNKINTLAWYDYVSFSAFVGTTSGYGSITPVAAGTIIATAELLFSYVLLVFVVAIFVQYFVQLRGGD